MKYNKSMFISIIGVMVVSNYAMAQFGQQSEDYKACNFHDFTYTIVPVGNSCPLNHPNIPPSGNLKLHEIGYPNHITHPGDEKVLNVHNSNCYDEELGGE
ncbi:MAG TPA: hypothetical protein PK055_07985 [Gammaproteobacteria bacterium]|nr:hypothetical protein [Xanthomonadales bacterium]MCB1595718.1 hypothetical protein [Xanthomonadales bacterium]HOP21960.1 hypothetical protein [Gammaproteobacteria bacterium]HPI95741.1 hypothetical protein [Gammaproteobacteria bacterium]HPQ87582.1 hypothetical protein [Gammaproteobacteria bacterium]